MSVLHIYTLHTKAWSIIMFLAVTFIFWSMFICLIVFYHCALHRGGEVVVLHDYLLNLERWLAIKSSFAGAGSDAMLRGSTTGSGSATALPVSHRSRTFASKVDKYWYNFFSLIGFTTQRLWAFGKQALYLSWPACSPDFTKACGLSALTLLSRAASCPNNHAFVWELSLFWTVFQHHGVVYLYITSMAKVC